MADYVGLETTGHVLLEDGTSGMLLEMSILGYNTPGATAVSLGTGRMQVSRFTLSQSGTLRELHGWFARGASTVRLVVYRHVSGANPYGTAALVAYTSPISLAGSGNAEISQAGFSVHLPAGDYYIGARSDVAGALLLGTNQGLGYVGVDSGAADPPSDPFPSSPTASGSTQLSCWAAVDPDVASADSASGTVTASGSGVESHTASVVYTDSASGAVTASGSGVESRIGPSAHLAGSAQVAFKAGPRALPVFDPTPALGEIVYWRRVGGAGGAGLMRVPASGGSATRLTNATNDHPSWSPDGRIAYGVDFGGVAISNGDGSGAVTLTDAYFSPSWSPDGSKILAVGPDSGTGFYQVVWLDPATGAVTVVYAATEFFYIGLSAQAWHPAGNRVVWTDTSHNRVYTVNVDGTGLTEITPSGFPFDDLNIDGVSWSPDGTRMAIASTNIYTMKPDGTLLRRRWSGGNNFARTVSWSPDSAKVAFTDDSGIQVMGADGTGLTRIFSDAFAEYLDWSKQRGPTLVMRGVPNFAVMNGQSQVAFRAGPKPTPHDPQPGLGAILYNSHSLGHWAVHRAPTVAGGTSTAISGAWGGGADAYDPAWGPDGRVVYLANNGDLVMADGDGTFPAAIESAAGFDYPSWSPDGTTILGYDYSDLVTVDLASGDRNVLVDASDFSVNLSAQAWSFDQTQVVFTDTSAREVWVVNSDGTGLTEITPIGVASNATPSSYLNYASWSPVEDKIALSDNNGLYVCDGDGNNVHLVYSATSVWGLAWSPDGKKLAIHDDTGIATLNADGSGFTRIVNDSTAWRVDWSRTAPPIMLTAATGEPPSTTVSMTGVASFAFSTDASLWYPPLGPRIPGAFYDRWKSGLHIGDSRPGQRVQVRRGRYFRRHGKWLGNDPMSGVHIVGYNLSNPWQAYWTPQSAYVDVPNVREVRFDQSTDQNGITTATVVVDNIFYRPEAGGQHTIERGQYASLRGYVAPDRTRLTDEQGQPVFPDAIWFGMLIQDAQITVHQSYGNQRIKTFTGLIDDVDTTSRPDVITVTARDFGKVLNDSFMFGWNKEQPDEGETLFRDPTVFIDPDDADKAEVAGDNAAASSGSGSADNVLDGDGATSWTSASHTTANYTEYVQVRLSEGRYNDFNVNVASDGMEMYVSLLPKNLKNGDSPTRNGTNIPDNQWVNGASGDTVPGDNGGIYYIRHIASVSEGVHHYNLTSDEDSFRVGDDSILRLSFRNLQRPAGSTRYSASVTAIKPLSRTLVPEAKKQHWVLVDDASDVVRVILRWAGFKEFEVESTGTSLSKRLIVNRGMTYMEVIKQIAELSGYIFFMSDPSARPDSLGVPIFRKSQIVTDAPSVVTVSDRDLLTAIDVKQTDEPLAYIIRMRGRESKKGRRLGGDLTRRVMYVYRPPWSGGHDKPPPTAGVRPPSHQLGGILRHVIHTNHMFKTIDDCKFACFYLALNEAIAASTTTIQIPANPGVQLDDHVELLDLATGVTSRLSVQQRSSEFVRSGEDTHWVMTLAGGLVDTPDISDVVYAINTAKRA